jgi:hypothetical protein
VSQKSSLKRWLASSGSGRIADASSLSLGGSERVAVVKLVLPAETSIYVAAMLLNDSPEPLAFASMSLSTAN